MKKITFLMLACIGLMAQAQIGIKAGLVYNGDKGLFKTANETYTDEGKNSVGFNVGIYKQFDFPVFYVKPELMYVSYKTEFSNPNGKSFDVKYNRLDLPVSVGTKILMNQLKLQAGPVFSYYFKDDITWSDVSDIKQNDISVGLQLGAGVEFSKLSFDLRYDVPLSKRQTTFVQNHGNFETQNTPRLLMLSVGYSL